MMYPQRHVPCVPYIGKAEKTPEGCTMTSLPFVVREKPLGIVIKDGKGRKPAVRFWAYMWAEDEEDSPGHWHDLVPVGPTG